jgi:predicted secreted protein
MAFDDKVIDGGDILLSVQGKVIACATSHSIELTNAVREISCKGSGDFTSAEYGRFSWTASTDALLNLGKDSATYVSYADLMALMIAKTIVSVESEYDQDGDAANTLTLTGNCIITSISQSAPDSDNASYSVSLQGRGALTVTEVEAS